MHTCTICFTASSDHPPECYQPECGSGAEHFPPLCCPGCPCGSFEEAHELEGIKIKNIEATVAEFMGQHPWRFWPGLIVAGFVDVFCWGKVRQRASDSIERWVCGQPIGDLLKDERNDRS